MTKPGRKWADCNLAVLLAFFGALICVGCSAAPTAADEKARQSFDRWMSNYNKSIHVFARSDFMIGDDGVVRLHPQLARAVASFH
jgi:hypothetical protein